MKQGETKRKLPIDKHKKESWKKRDAARKPLQEAAAARKLLAQEEDLSLGEPYATGDPS
jgi:hypothetical protein